MTVYGSVMRFRRKDWDFPMPAELAAYWTAWNESDLDQVRGHLVAAVTTDVEWNDPRDSFVGIDELEAAVRRLRGSKPDYVFTVVSEIDRHHDRLRYRWDMQRNQRTLMEGLDHRHRRPGKRSHCACGWLLRPSHTDCRIR